MWNQACSQSLDGMTSDNAGTLKRSTLQILPCTVSQLLSASQGSNDAFTICNWELNQVSVVGVVVGVAPFVTNIQFSVDDMTGPPFNVKQWVNTEDCAPTTSASPGAYVKVIGSLRSFNGQRSLLAMKSRRIKDLNEITSHMLDVVHAHKQHFGKVFDVNMNITAASPSGRVLKQSGDGHLKVPLPHGLTTLQGQVLTALRRFSVCDAGIGFQELQTQLDHFSPRDIRTALTFLTDEGHAFCTIDEHHFKSTEY
ncbi:replication protein A 32 kDa subunit-like [Cyclopterus lumpus]|uniref:replication protein A 32 kDa subunit-like n=1 Tax=Cyclopterus lumpus TaxID=8103 RepID=UPI0014874479|nr:replication protein A 32 kDa subunit-like [Cyclopterus lumpus]